MKDTGQTDCSEWEDKKHLRWLTTEQIYLPVLTTCLGCNPYPIRNRSRRMPATSRKQCQNKIIPLNTHSVVKRSPKAVTTGHRTGCEKQSSSLQWSPVYYYFPFTITKWCKCHRRKRKQQKNKQFNSRRLKSFQNAYVFSLLTGSYANIRKVSDT